MTADSFSRNIAISTAVHVFVGLITFVRIFFFPADPIDFQEAIRVDIVGLPQKMTEPPKLEPPGEPAKPEPVKKTATKNEPTPTPEPKAPVFPSKAKKPDTAKSQKDILAKLNKSVKMDNALDKIKESLKNDSKPGTKIAGNVVSQGNSLTGLQRLDYDSYITDVKTKVFSNWNIPQWLADGNFKAQVRVIIDERGYVVKKVILRSSGNEVFDAKAIEAVDASSPFSPPPDRLRAFLSTNGAVFNFPE